MPNNTEITQTEESLVSNFVNMSVQTSDSIFLNSDNKKLNVSFQENDHPIKDSALKWWRAARSSGTRRMEYTIRAAHLHSLIKNDIYPSWSLGLEPLPGYLKSSQARLLAQTRLHAQERMKLITEILMEKAADEQQEYRGHLTTVSNIYNKDTAGLELALSTLRKAITKSGRTLREKLDKRKDFLSTNQISDGAILSKMGLQNADPQSSAPREQQASSNNNRRNPKTRPGSKRPRSKSPSSRTQPRGPKRQQKQRPRPNTQQQRRAGPNLTYNEMAVLKNILKKHGQHN
jgi:hypothetical protein